MSASSGPPLMTSEAIDEETIPNHGPNDYFSTHPGQLLNDRYQTITKLGWGFGSTVWLAEDLQRCEEQSTSPQYVAVKIGTSRYGSIAAAEHELKLSQRIATANPSHPGASYIRVPIDDFQINGSHGDSHRKSLDFTLLSFYKDSTTFIPSAISSIRANLKDDNILVDLESESVLEDFVQQQRQIPPLRHVTDDGHVTYMSQGDFGPLRDYFILPEIADLDLA
ncbi:hypothetical protein ACEPPN_001247 [Leptodophora sp. 'Broadleaf-Isolate-01']